MTANPGEHESEEAHTEGQPGAVPADTFAVRLVLSRHHAGRLSIEQAAKRCGLNSGNWANWEDGRQPRDRVEVAQQIAEGLGMDFDWLLLGGPLIPARGKPVNRPDVNMRRKPQSTVRPPDTRPNTRDDSSRSKSPAGAGRRAVPIR
jgi:transcriptional regulator with XRE-family HTH domain